MGSGVMFCEWQKDINDDIGEVIIYLPSTGDVHLITKSAADILKILENQSLTIEEIISQLSGMDEYQEGVVTNRDLLTGYLEPFYQLGILQVEN